MREGSIGLELREAFRIDLIAYSVFVLFLMALFTDPNDPFPSYSLISYISLISATYFRLLKFFMFGAIVILA